ncbi:MAG: hypothetical protein IKR25_07420 [Muribaculaceae bacterium]|nr:hypothetical protein [Muribaculaceae bacterium]
MIKIKRWFSVLQILIVAIIVTPTFTSCGDDEPNNENVAKMLIGTWQFGEMNSQTISFDGTHFTIAYQENMTISGTYQLSKSEDGIWKIAMRFDNGGNTFEYYMTEITNKRFLLHTETGIVEFIKI